METDRPDVTESAYSVSAGHFQFESDLVRMAFNKSDGLSNTEIAYNLANLKLGLTEKMDIQFVIPTFVSIRTTEIATDKLINKSSGFDDITVRIKYNIWGNKGGKTALAVMPYISFPTSSISYNGHTGGVIIPFALELKKGWSFGTQIAIGFSKEDNDRYYNGYLYSFTFGKTLSSKLSVFTESYISYASFEKSTEAYFNGGIVYALGDNFNLDAGFNYGLTKASDKVLFTGFSFRL